MTGDNRSATDVTDHSAEHAHACTDGYAIRTDDVHEAHDGGIDGVCAFALAYNRAPHRETSHHVRHVTFAPGEKKR